MTPDVSSLLNIIQNNIKCKKCNWNKRLGCLSPCLSEKNEKKNKVTCQLGFLKSCWHSAISIAKAVVSLHKQHPTIKQIGSLSSHHYINSPLPRKSILSLPCSISLFQTQHPTTALQLHYTTTCQQTH